jgi:hypothetical protein
MNTTTSPVDERGRTRSKFVQPSIVVSFGMYGFFAGAIAFGAAQLVGEIGGGSRSTARAVLQILAALIVVVAAGYYADDLVKKCRQGWLAGSRDR